MNEKWVNPNNFQAHQEHKLALEGENMTLIKYYRAKKTSKGDAQYNTSISLKVTVQESLDVETTRLIGKTVGQARLPKRTKRFLIEAAVLVLREAKVHIELS